MILFALAGLFVTYLAYSYFKPHYKDIKYQNKKDVPTVKGGYPLIGHGLEFSKDVLGFMEKCYQDYGKIFKINVFGLNMTMVCDRNLVVQLLKEKEDNLSLYDVFDRILFFDSFMSNTKDKFEYMKIIREVITLNFNAFMPKIKSEAQRMVSNLSNKIKINNKVNLTDEMKKFIINTSAQCFTKLDDNLTDEFISNLNKFSDIVNKTITLSSFLPKWLLCNTIIKYGNIYKNKLIASLNDEIEKYRQDPDKTDSILFRKAVDHENKYSNQQIGEMLLILLYASAENTALGLTATLIELSRDKDMWQKVHDECTKHIKNNDDLESVFKSPIVDACMTEALRLNSHIFGITRKPIALKTLGDYYIGDCDSVAVSTALLMSGTCANDLYKEPKKYDPARFLEPRFEKKTSDGIINFSAYLHNCPGKQFAIYEIKTALAYFIVNFERFDISDSDYNTKQLCSTAVIPERNSVVELQLSELKEISKN